MYANHIEVMSNIYFSVPTLERQDPCNPSPCGSSELKLHLFLFLIQYQALDLQDYRLCLRLTFQMLSVKTETVLVHVSVWKDILEIHIPDVVQSVLSIVR